MEKDPDTIPIAMTGPRITTPLRQSPSMGFIFPVAIWKGMWRSSIIARDREIPNLCLVLNNQSIDETRLARYCGICGFSNSSKQEIPISYFQMLFVGLLGKFIVSDAFPVSPMGLIHIFQSFDQKRVVNTDEILDLSCTLSRIIQTPKGIESHFSLDVRVSSELVWQGVSVFLTKKKTRKKKPAPSHPPTLLNKQETIFVPPGTGRKYASVSGDYNPHHMYDILARLFGFKQAIAHGMWSLARVMAGLEKEIEKAGQAFKVEAFFKRPIFMPATLALGVETPGDETNKSLGTHFELRDDQSGIPHVKGTLVKTDQDT